MGDSQSTLNYLLIKSNRDLVTKAGFGKYGTWNSSKYSLIFSDCNGIAQPPDILTGCAKLSALMKCLCLSFKAVLYIIWTLRIFPRI